MKTTWMDVFTIALVCVVALAIGVGVRTVRAVRARRRAHDQAVWQRSFRESGGNVTTFPGYDRQLQQTAVEKTRAEERRRLRELQARAKAKPKKATVVSIADRKASR